MRRGSHPAVTLAGLLLALAAAFAQVQPAGDGRQPPDEQIIQTARDAAASFKATLPDYLAERAIVRYTGYSGRLRRGMENTQISWRILDMVTTEVAYQAGNEEYRGVRINGRPAASLPEVGLWSTGEYSGSLEQLLSPEARAVFTRRGDGRVASRPALVYEYRVEQANSQWILLDPDQRSFNPAYEGKIWIDRETGRTLRFTKRATSIPKDFPVSRGESTTEYAFVKIDGRPYLVPTLSETMGCLRDTGVCMKNVITFRKYRKFTADSLLKYE
jgi:hypothetical protein